MFLRNQWLWFHMLAAGVYSKVLLAAGVQDNVIASTVVLASLAWEVFEFIKDDVTKIYGSKRAFFADAFGDIIGAVVICFLIVI